MGDAVDPPGVLHRLQHARLLARVVGDRVVVCGPGGRAAGRRRESASLGERLVAGGAEEEGTGRGVGRRTVLLDGDEPERGLDHHGLLLRRPEGVEPDVRHLGEGAAGEVGRRPGLSGALRGRPSPRHRAPSARKGGEAQSKGKNDEGRHGARARAREPALVFGNCSSTIARASMLRLASFSWRWNLE